MNVPACNHFDKQQFSTSTGHAQPQKRYGTSFCTHNVFVVSQKANQGGKEASLEQDSNVFLFVCTFCMSSLRTTMSSKMEKTIVKKRNVCALNTRNVSVAY